MTQPTPGDGGRWLVLVVRVPTEPSRYRVAVWRELRRIGAVTLGSSVWTVPAVTSLAAGVERVKALVAEFGGTTIALDCRPQDDIDHQMLVAEFTAARTAEWVEFRSECAKFEDEIAKEHRTGKYTLAELDEEEQSLDRLRRWARELRRRDLFGSPEAAAAEADLTTCEATLERFTDKVYETIHSPIPPAADE